MNELDDRLNLYYSLGYNEDKYLKYYEKGILKEKIAKNCDEEDINFASDYFEEKGPRLVKKR